MATGPGGEASESVTIDVMPPVTLQITSPVPMQNIARPDIMVEGTISNYLGNETGVTVNGQVAMVFNDHFVANHVPLQDGENTITVIGTDSHGYTATAEITVYADISGDYITLTADTESGVSPFETRLQVDGTFSFLQEPIITPTGPDDVDPFENLGDAQYRIGMATPGIYCFTAEATDDQSNTYTDTIAVVVLDQAQLDALLRAKWNAMRNALTLNDIDSAVNLFDSTTKDAFRNAFSALSPTQLVDIADELNNVQFIKMKKNSVEYDIRIFENDEEYSYYLLFIKSKDGIWKLRSF